MAGHVQDRWTSPKRDENGKLVLGKNGKPLREKNSLWGKGDRYKVRWYDPDGKEDSKSFPDKELTKARAFLTKQQHDVLAGTYMPPDAGKVKFKAYAQSVLMGRTKDPSSVRTVTSNLENQVYPFLGGRYLETIKVDVIRKWFGWMDRQKRPPSNTYRRQLFDMVSSILQAAVDEGKIRTNPCKDKSISRPPASQRKVQVWPEAKMRKVHLALPARRKIMVPLGAGLGLRQGEILAFSMDNVDRDRMVYRCTRQLVRIHGKFMWKLPKRHKTRDIPLGDGLLEELDDYVENYQPVSIMLPWGEQDGKKFETVNVLMTNEQGGLDSGVTINDTVWRPAFATAELDYNPDRSDGMHALRHLFASSMLARGVSIKELSVFLGHSSEAFTLKTYVHLMPDSFDKARLAANAMFKPRKPRAVKESGGMA
ncbi:tyrosine-type recombinase/integrase [Kutzneria albida]|uniref:Tyr recombinase domain-containing protein n=1 Tax=Kutzneria albida DSM 43870 TaxID=1449976 RepID=W5W9L3_9PSEU|nr:site-specific integrase [Kutzneria albida]AHH94894.1 hypothetical protein KALB_1522 [Kutzneria albida DSM 43870]